MTRNDEMRYKFYKDLYALLRTALKTDKRTFPGDFDVRVGTDHAACEGVPDPYSLDDCINNGLFLSDGHLDDATAAALAHSDLDAFIFLMGGDSKVEIGAVLQEHLVGQTKPLTFFSPELAPTEWRYITFGRELLAIYLAVNHFRYFL
ncbi:hypothetical protein SprV_0100381100 [Sparganum proliferum]